MESSAARNIFRNLPLLWLSLAFVAGIALARLLPGSAWAWLLVATSLAAAALWPRAKRSDRAWLAWFALLGACALLLGAVRYQAALPIFAQDDLAFYNDESGWVRVEGTLAEPPVQRSGYLELRLQANSLTFAGGAQINVEGLLLVRADEGAGWHYGDTVVVRGELMTPPEDSDFSYREYLAREGVHSLMPFAAAERGLGNHGLPFWAALYDIRGRAVDTLYQLYSAPQAALLAGILLGDESGLSAEAKESFNVTGTRHIIAISGFNISLVAGGILALARPRLGPRRAAWLAGGAVALYTLLVGAEPSVVRAAIMGLIGLLALQTGRQAFALNSLAITAAVMNAINPLLLTDVGFQLSFAATLGILVYVPVFHRRLDPWMTARFGPRWPRLSDYVLMTVAAQLATLPILVFYFQRLSLYSLPANLLILPVQPALMVVGAVSVMLGVLLLPLGQLLALAGWALAAFTIQIVEMVAALPGSALSLPNIGWPIVVVLYGVMGVMTYAPLRAWLLRLRVCPAAGLGALSLASVLLWNSALAAPDGLLKITALDVDGEAFLIVSPTGRYVLVNSGEDAAALGNALAANLPVGARLDWVLVTGRRPEQIGALQDGLERLPVDNLAYAGESETIQAISSKSIELDLHTEALQAGQSFQLGEGAHLQVLATGPRGAVLLLSWEEFEVLLPLGLDPDQEAELTFSPVDVLVLPDGGYAPLNAPDWVAALQPQIAWVAGDEDVEVPQAQIAVPILRVTESGWLRVSTDGKQLWLETER